MIEKYKSREIRHEIRKVLMKTWDPIGVEGVLEAQDEYDFYLGDVFELITRRASEKEIADYLDHVETNRMGLSIGDRQRLLKAAQALLEIKID